MRAHEIRNQKNPAKQQKSNQFNETSQKLKAGMQWNNLPKMARNYPSIHPSWIGIKWNRTEQNHWCGAVHFWSFVWSDLRCLGKVLWLILRMEGVGLRFSILFYFLICLIHWVYLCFFFEYDSHDFCVVWNLLDFDVGWTNSTIFELDLMSNFKVI